MRMNAFLFFLDLMFDAFTSMNPTEIRIMNWAIKMNCSFLASPSP